MNNNNNNIQWCQKAVNSLSLVGCLLFITRYRDLILKNNMQGKDQR